MALGPKSLLTSLGVTVDALLENSCVGQTIDDVCKRRFTSEYYRRALATVEQLVIKHGVLDVSNVISAVVTSMLCSILSVLCNLFLLFFLYFMYDFILVNK